MDIIDKIGMLTEGKFIDEYLVFYPDVDISKDGFAALKRAMDYVEKNYNVKGEGILKDNNEYTFSFQKGEHVGESIHSIYWDESSKMLNQSGRLYTLYYQSDIKEGIPFKNNRELAKILSGEGVPKK